MSWIHDCTHHKGRKLYDGPCTRRLGDWIDPCPHCSKPKPMTYPERISTLTADLDAVTAELERKQRECEGLRELIERWMAYGIRQRERGAPFPQPLFDDTEAALSAGGSDGNA